MYQVDHPKEYGMRAASVEFDFADIMDRVHRVIKTIEPKDSVDRFTGLGVECIQGNAKITSPYSVEVNGQSLTTRSIIVAAGAVPLVPPIEGIEEVDYLTSDNVWELRQLPKRLLVLGGGPIGCELSQAFSRLGAKVIQVEMLPRLLSKEDPEVSELIEKRFAEEGVDLRLGHTAKAATRNESGIQLVCEHNGEKVVLEADQLLMALGRRARVGGYGLEELGVELAQGGTIQVDEYLRTAVPTIFACGDVAGPYQFTHVASHQAWYASVNALFGSVKKFKVD